MLTIVPTKFKFKILPLSKIKIKELILIKTQDMVMGMEEVEEISVGVLVVEEEVDEVVVEEIFEVVLVIEEEVEEVEVIGVERGTWATIMTLPMKGVRTTLITSVMFAQKWGI